MDSRKENQLPPLSLEEAVSYLKEHTQAIRETLVLPISEAAGYSLAEPVFALHDQPPFPRSPFDGYAVRSCDTAGAGTQPAVLRVIGEVDAGGWFEGTVGPGEAVRIMTGAPIPDGADAVIKQEETDLGEETVTVFREMRRLQNYIFPGEDFKKGSLLLPEGEQLGPVEIGILAGNGMGEVRVFRHPRVIVISTGDELTDTGLPLGPGKIYDSNRYTIALQLKAWNCRVCGVFHSPDDPDSCADMIREWEGRVDLIVTTGGVSVGKKDIMHDVYDRLGLCRIFWKVGIKPGAAMMAGRFGNTMVLSLSGNPYAAYVDLHMLVRPVISKLTGSNSLEMVRQKAVLQDDYPRSSDRRRFVRCHVQDGKAVTEGHTGGNGDIASGRHVNAMIDIPAGSGPLHAGDEVTVILI